ncbi:MAG: response regulator transcription factor [Candidatus Tectomicrobia bacterium]|uniref:Response regulator transcription factor n=1 Tax=Tectimicrobiota bacterium TaxID=2528274 RepID=A0A932GNQ1_UNCTE|nr:response regulator transcription factor [Candidatus Tectomicrobia bacterium]
MLVDDHALFRQGVRSALESEADIEVVGEARTGTEAIVKSREIMPDVILMDIYMPEADGLEATRKIMSEIPYVKIIMLTVAEEDAKLFEAIKAGAKGYLLKNIDPKDLLEMVRGVSGGEAPISRVMAAKILGEFSRQGRDDVVCPASGGKLSPREMEVLKHLTDGASNREIATALGISENTVKNHLRNILEKLHLQNRVQAAAYALRQGLTGPPRGPE